jgi:hypothetical protein
LTVLTEKEIYMVVGLVVFSSLSEICEMVVG